MQEQEVSRVSEQVEAPPRVLAGEPELWVRDPRGTFYCQGCHYGIVQRLVAEVLKELDLGGRTIGSTGAGCAYSFFYGLDVDQIAAPHGRSPDVATAVKRLFPDRLVVTVQGDGDCIAIGAEPLIAAASRAERITVIMLNNGGYALTGGQLAPTTLLDQVTSTTPQGRHEEHGHPVHVPELLATMKGVVYCARGTVHTPSNYARTKKYIKAAFRRQMSGEGFTFVEVLSACPTYWHMSPLECLGRIGDTVVSEFPLGEIKRGEPIKAAKKKVTKKKATKK
jgi:2-oxoglutarate ferredoxin oxidoreductase subunit beta